MAERLDWIDPTLREWDCTVVWSDPADPEAGIVLDRSAFYPGGGGQPPDHGVLLWQGVQTRIVDTRKGDELHLIPAPGDPVPPVGATVRGAIDDERRSTLMRTHSGLHILCGTVFRDFGALVTGGNMQPGEARMDFNLPEVPAGFKQSLEDAVNAEIAADRKIVARVLPREEALQIPDPDPHPGRAAAAGAAGDPGDRHRRPGRAGRRRHARGLHRSGGPDRGGQGREQGPAEPPGADPPGPR